MAETTVIVKVLLWVKCYQTSPDATEKSHVSRVIILLKKAPQTTTSASQHPVALVRRGPSSSRKIRIP